MLHGSPLPSSVSLSAPLSSALPDLRPLVKGHLNQPPNYQILPDHLATKKITEWKEPSDAAGFGSARRAIIIGVDGVGGYYLQRKPAKISLPNLQKYFVENGSYTLQARSIAPAISKPNWATILCSAELSSHGMKDNDWTVGRADQPPNPPTAYFPSVFQAVKEQKPEDKVASFTDWIGWNHIFPNSLVNTTFTSINDPDAIGVTTSFIEQVVLSDNDYTLSCIHFDDADETAHSFGWGSEEYWKAIQILDQCIGMIMKALEKTNRLEDTIVIVVSDHGGEEKDHGQNESDLNMMVPIYVRGPQVKKNHCIDVASMGMDVSATAMWALGLKQPKCWHGCALPVFES